MPVIDNKTGKHTPFVGFIFYNIQKGRSCSGIGKLIVNEVDKISGKRNRIENKVNPK